MRQVMYIGSSPCDEPCAQVGQPHYARRAQIECRALIGQLRRELGLEPEHAVLSVAACPHEFGVYYEVVCHYRDTDGPAMKYAYDCEGCCPDRWDEVARNEIATRLEAEGICS